MNARRSLRLLALPAVLALALVVSAGRASAQGADPVPAPPPVPAAPAQPTTPPPATAPTAAGEASYHSPMRTACEDELAKDKDWFNNLKNRLAGALFTEQQQYEKALKDYEAGGAQGQRPAPPQAPSWFADLSDRMNRQVHADASHYATRNNRHVIYAYAVFWLFTAAFVVVLWRRQRVLKAELDRLEGELARAVKEGGAA